MQCSFCRRSIGLGGHLTKRGRCFCNGDCSKRYNVIHPLPWWHRYRLVLIIAIAVIVALALFGKAYANPWDNAPEAIKKWFNEQVDENDKLCCDSSDALPVQVEKKSGVYQFLYLGIWYDIPPEKIRFVEMPKELEGRQIVFANLVNGTMYVHCVRLPIPKI